MASVKILVEGYTNVDLENDDGKEKTCPNITLIQDKNLNIVVDPGVLESQNILVEALRKEGLTTEDIDIVFLTHSHIDHFRNIGMFKRAKTLEYFGLWDKNTVEDRKNQVTENVEVIETPGHSNDGLSLVVNTDQGKVVICGDVFWKENEPENDPYATDKTKLAESRKKILAIADWIIPGHGKMFKVKKS
ncbi:MAG: MBL fold metallo-hydrolase [Patescibacteria group bacterium]|nr:MBL fold metallo-hydrolase [Patescibacteria group bacterium]